jgi:cation diffusion facilitator family transporter
MRLAMRLSLLVGLLMLVAKLAATLYTGSAAVLSDAAESVIHVVAVGFAAFSLWLSVKPASDRFRYGYERISYFSAGFEGALIILAAVSIIFVAVRRWIAGPELQYLGGGAGVVLAAALLNAGLGIHLIRTGRRTGSIILEANGRHVLTDSWTSLGVVAGLVLVLLTGRTFFDPLCAIAVALNILWSGGQLVWRSVTGLMDYSDPALAADLEVAMDSLCSRLDVRYHGLRFRNTGYRTLVDVHLLFSRDFPVGEAHRLATLIEQELPTRVKRPLEVATHLESLEDHEQVHEDEHHTRR